jgi:RHS repeat-associated protein
VTEYGADLTTTLPQITFQYQGQNWIYPSFGLDTIWPGVYSQGQTNDPGWNCIRATDANSDNYAITVDLDGDGLPDRVMRKKSYQYTDYFSVQRNTGNGFAPVTDDYQWGPLINPEGQIGTAINSPSEATSSGIVNADLIDVNGDGYLDRVINRCLTTPYSDWFVQLNKGIPGANGFSNSTSWTAASEAGSSYPGWNAIKSQSTGESVCTLDINGDGLPDRIMSKLAAPFDRFKVQFNNGTNFASGLVDWATLDSGTNSIDWNQVSQKDPIGNWKEVFMDINGDGLPDRVMRQLSAPYQNFVVQLNNGAGFEPAENWGPLDSPDATASYNSPIGTGGEIIWANLIDINGDGLPDRVMRINTSPYYSWQIQLNTGSGFAPAITWVGIDGQSQPNDPGWNAVSYTDSQGYTKVDFFDINGDGLPDRVMRDTTAPYTNWVVQLNQGPFPDLMSSISNGIGGSVQVSYIPSTTLDNRNTNWVSDPWSSGVKSLLPFNVWVVSHIAAKDGLGNISTNFYAFKGGYYNASQREFRGFSQATVTDPLGTKSTTYFHQSGGRDNRALGEYLDQTSTAKKGIPFRIETIGNDGSTNKLTLNKVEEVMLNSNGCYFPFISQSLVMNYEGLSSYRAIAKQFSYDTNTENLLEEIDLGEVTNVVVNGQSFADVGSDSVYTWMTYTNLGSPFDIKITSDSAGANRLRETQMFYDSRGNLTGNQVWLDTAGTYITTVSTSYDQYGNPNQATDAAGITTTTVYDSTYKQYPLTQITGTFTNQFAYDVRSGLTLQAIDAKGLVASNSFDVLYRSTASYISTTAYGAPTLWKTKMSYSLGGISSGVSQNYVHKQVNDATDANGFETYTYLDGIGRTIQTRAEAETGQFRVANAVYDKRGNAYFQTLPYFSSGSGFTSISGTYLGTLTEFDTLGRAYRVTPAVQGSFTSGKLTSTNSTGGDTGSPVGAVTSAFVDGGNPWASVATDSEGKVKKACRDAYGRTITITEVTSAGNYNTTYIYDLLGNLTNVTDNANNKTSMAYDSLGRKTSMTDPDMGTWSYVYDNAGRMTQQIDARTNKLTFTYSDQLGRLTSKQIYNSANSLVGTMTYIYDTSDDPNYTVFKGQLYKVTDLQGYQRSSYDVRGRVVKTGRFLNVNAMEYVTQSTYDDADRVQTITYPGNSATIKYAYDTAGNLIQVKSLAGTGTQETFYTPQSFNALGQLTAYTDGAGVVTTNVYFANSKRLQRVWVVKGTTNFQDLSYTYDTVSDIKSIGDNVYTGGASASISTVSYDDLYRVTSVNSTARGAKTYGYNSVGNVLTNQDFGSGTYQYGARPHAVTSANGTSYGYDACGNMTTRGNQTLTYDEQNQLTKVSTTNGTVLFGYDDAGERLWRCGTNGYSVWIGGLYEINNGKVLCHVAAGGKKIATFEPLCGGLWSKAIGEKNWYVASTKAEAIFNWPFKNGRGQWTMFGGTWAAILGVCLMAGHKTRLQRYEIKRALRGSLLWKQAVTFASISAFLLASTPEVHAAPAYGPVFYYYHNDNLGSSNVLTDRSGQMVQHYEYATFGQSSYQNNISAYQVSNRYTGQICDDETGLYYYGARYYDPQLGRFIQPDTIVPSADAPQSLNRYSYCDNNPLNYTDPSGHSFFGDIFKALGSLFKSPLTWAGIAIGFALGGPIGALIGLGISVGITVVSAIVANIAGPEAGMIAGAVLSIAFAAYGIYEGVGMIGTSEAKAITLISSSTLSIGSSSASLAGENELANDFSYASLAMSTAGYGLVKDITNGINTEGTDSGNHKVGLMGIGQTDGSGAQDLANKINGPVAWVQSEGKVIDVFGEVWKIATFGLLDTAGRQFAQLANQQGGNTVVIAHSGGAASVVFDGLLGRFNNNVTLIKLYSSPVNQLVVDGAGWISGSHFEFESRNWRDVSTFYSISLNPAKCISGLVVGPFYLDSGHAIKNYIK